MIPPIFARAVEKDIWVLGICADYLEDKGVEASILRTIVDNAFLLDDSGYCDSSFYNYGDGHYNSPFSNGGGYGDGYYAHFYINGCCGYGFEHGYLNGNGRGSSINGFYNNGNGVG